MRFLKKQSLGFYHQNNAFDSTLFDWWVQVNSSNYNFNSIINNGK